MQPAPLPKCKIDRLGWSDPPLGTIECPKRPMVLSASFGSGLTRRRGDPPGILWGLGDRGPNLKVKVAVKRYGLDHLRSFKGAEGAKVMPRPDLGPTIAELRVLDDRVELVSEVRLLNADGTPVSGLPTPGGEHAECEPALNMEGDLLEPDPNGADTEAIAAFADGSFFLGEEYGPSLLKVSADGRVLSRWRPGILPKIAGKRQLNRGFEAISLSPDEAWLYLAFQSPLAHPDKQAHERARHVRLWKLNPQTGEVAAQFLYPLDKPGSFRRDAATGDFGRSDIKVSEIVAEADDSLLVLERGSETTKIYRTRLEAPLALDASHLDIGTRPTIEEMSGDGGGLPELSKQLLFSTDAHTEMAADLEGMAILSERELLLVSDNDFGVEEAETSFWRVKFDEPMFAHG
ncbi:MAG TPA: esterase-like activity of phytase family protein [Allosphingosinicella sp.]